MRTRHLPEWSPPEAWPLSFDEVGIVVNLVFRSRCAISGLRPQDPSRPQFCLCPLDEDGPPVLRNTLFVTLAAAAEHRERGVAAMPPALRRRIDGAFASALGVEGREGSARWRGGDSKGKGRGK